MGQVNISYDDQLIANLDRVAAARRMARPELLRAIATEAVEASDAGRLAFQRDDAPRLDVSINALVARLNEGIVELERTQRANQLHEKKLLGAFAGTEENVRAARDQLAAQVNDVNRKSYQPFLRLLRELQVDVGQAEERALAAVKQEVIALHDHMNVVEKAASEARVQNNLVLGDDRMLSFKFLGCLSVPVGLLFILLFLLFVGQAQSLAVPVADRMLADAEHVCRLLNGRYGVNDCAVPKDDRKRAVQIIEADK
jgi:hypothetical protein